jgi:hypothetical protein
VIPGNDGNRESEMGREQGESLRKRGESLSLRVWGIKGGFFRTPLIPPYGVNHIGKDQMIIDMAVLLIACWILWACIKWTINNRRKKQATKDRLRILNDLKKGKRHGE